MTVRSGARRKFENITENREKQQDDMYDVLIIGCGVTGAAAAYSLARYDLKVGIVERFNDVACGATKANSAIMHAGYDPHPGTKMASLNRLGIKAAKKICKKLDVEYRPLQSLVLAFSEKDMEAVRELYARGKKNGADVRILDRKGVLAAEPAASPDCVGALHSRDSAIINPWEFALAMAEVAVINGADLLLEHKVTGIRRGRGKLTVVTDRGELETRFVVNAAGAFAEDISAMAGDTSVKSLPRAGQYYVLDKEEGKKVNSVIFRCPDENGFKGVLVAPTVHGNLLVGPDAEPRADADDLSTDRESLDRIMKSGLSSVPSVNFRNIIREYTGVRPTTSEKDFVIGVSRSCRRMINLAGICSPGLSSAPAIGDEAVRLLGKQGLVLKRRRGFIDERPPVVRLAELDDEEKRRVIEENPLYGNIICRCETVSEGEIVDALRRPIVPRSIDAIKRRCRAGMGRCQGGFCSPRVHEIISRELGVPMEDVMLDKQGSFIITGRTGAEEN